eukprot:4478569-Pleurochrysis_carterae.AAC.3
MKLKSFADLNAFSLFETKLKCLSPPRVSQLFLQTMFKAEEKAAAAEGVVLPQRAEFCDNAGCLAMLEQSPRAIFRLLDTCCAVAATPQNFCLQVGARASFSEARRLLYLRALTFAESRNAPFLLDPFIWTTLLFGLVELARRYNCRGGLRSQFWTENCISFIDRKENESAS